MKIIKTPIRALGKARDLYVRSLTGCATRSNYGANYGAELPRSFSTSVVSSVSANDDEDYRELVRAASVRGLGHENEMKMVLEQQLRQEAALIAAAGSNGRLPKSCSVGMGRIDEDKACEFGDDDKLVVDGKEPVYPRSRSYAVSKRSGGMFGL